MKKKMMVLITGLMVFSMACLGGCGAAAPAPADGGAAAPEAAEKAEAEAGTESEAESGKEAAEKEGAAAGEAAAEAPASDGGEEDLSEKGSAGLANPWMDITEDEARGMAQISISAPEGAENIKWSRMEDGDSPLIQLTFDLEGDSFTARQQATGDESEDISGMNYEWIVEDEITLAGWGGGNMKGRTYRYIGENEYADLCAWYDGETGNSYSLSVVAPDLDGFDIQAVAEALYCPESPAEGTAAEEHKAMDITSCDTFTDIVDKLKSGQGFANAVINGTDVLLVTDYIYDFEGNETYAAIDSDVYYYDADGVPVWAGYVTAGGTAYPLGISEGKLYACGNHFVNKMILKDGKMVIDEEAYVNYDSNGTGTYYYDSDTHEADPGKKGPSEDDSILNSFFDEYNEKAQIIVFNKIS